MPRNWGIPSPRYNYRTGKYVSGGMVWKGKKPAEESDIAALVARFGDSVKVDEESLVGRKDPAYTSFFYSCRKHKDYAVRVVKLG